MNRQSLSTGIPDLDKILGGLFIGDNVVWLDSNGSLAFVFCMNFMRISQSLGLPLIYVSFDRSPRNLIDKLGDLAVYDSFVILDCFTNGKGGSSKIFKKFYEAPEDERPCKVVQVQKPGNTEQFMDQLYSLHSTYSGEVRFVIESVTGMQELWGGEDHFLTFYSHSCPRLYELNTIAYWIMERGAHSSRMRASISQIAQVVIDLSIKRGTTSLNVVKAENRELVTFHRPHNYWNRGSTITFDGEKKGSGFLDLGLRLKEYRTIKGLSQSELAKLVGVTPSTISQVESNLIYPSIPALLKMTEVLGIEVSAFFQEKADAEDCVFHTDEAIEVKLASMAGGSMDASLLLPRRTSNQAELYLIEFHPGQLTSHFFAQKGEEMGYVLSGSLFVKLAHKSYTLSQGDVIHLKSEIPLQWKNLESIPAKLLWIKFK